MKILYVEDNADNIVMVQSLLNSSVLHVIPLDDPAHFIETVSDERPDAILMDLNLPGYSGLDLMYDLSETPGLSHIPVIVLTADSTPQTWHECRKAGCHTFLMKPIKPRVLLDTVSHLFTMAV